MKLSKIIPKNIRKLLYKVLHVFYPYYISCVGEMILNPKFWEGRLEENWMAGRIEVFKDGPYAEYEIRYFTDKKEWADFVNNKDFSNYSKRGLKRLEKWIKNNFDHAPKWN